MQKPAEMEGARRYKYFVAVQRTNIMMIFVIWLAAHLMLLQSVSEVHADVYEEVTQAQQDGWDLDRFEMLEVETQSWMALDQVDIQSM